MKKKSSTWFCAALLCFGFLGTTAAADDSMASKCGAEFQKVMPCLPFATSKAEAPSKDCCDSVTALKGTNPACLCFIIQQIHNGSNEAIKKMGVQESRLLQLPSACKLANASVSECPRLLHLPPNSPDAAIFSNVSAAPTTSSPSATAGGSSSATRNSNGIWHKQRFAWCMNFAIGIFFLRFPSIL